MSDRAELKFTMTAEALQVLLRNAVVEGWNSRPLDFEGPMPETSIESAANRVGFSLMQALENAQAKNQDPANSPMLVGPDGKSLVH